MGLLETFVSRFEAGKDADGVFIVNRHDDSGPGEFHEFGVEGAGQVERVAASHLDEEPDDCGPKGKGEGDLQENKEDKNRLLERGEPINLEHVECGPGNCGDGKEREREKAQTASKNR